VATPSADAQKQTVRRFFELAEGLAWIQSRLDGPVTFELGRATLRTTQHREADE